MSKFIARITVRSERPDTEDAVSLIRQLDEDIWVRYPEMPTEVLDGLGPSDLAEAKFTFLIARVDGRAVGCGALRYLGPGVAEVKRMYVLPEFRRHGIARRILSALESRALELGHATLRIETGKGQPEAVRLYMSSGYREIEAFGKYDRIHSLFFEKQLL